MWLRTANTADLKAVNALLVKTMHHTFDVLLGAAIVDKITDEFHSVAALSRNLAKPYSEFVVADNGEGKLVGMAFASQSKPKIADLHQLYVDPDHHVQGIGTMLLAEIEMAFPDVEKLSLGVVSLNQAALDFYQRKGFVTTGQSTDWGALDLNIAVSLMEKPLTGWSI